LHDQNNLIIGINAGLKNNIDIYVTLLTSLTFSLKRKQFQGLSSTKTLQVSKFSKVNCLAFHSATHVQSNLNHHQ